MARYLITHYILICETSKFILALSLKAPFLSTICAIWKNCANRLNAIQNLLEIYQALCRTARVQQHYMKHGNSLIRQCLSSTASKVLRPYICLSESTSLTIATLHFRMTSEVSDCSFITTPNPRDNSHLNKQRSNRRL